MSFYLYRRQGLSGVTSLPMDRQVLFGPLTFLQKLAASFFEAVGYDLIAHTRAPLPSPRRPDARRHC